MEQMTVEEWNKLDEAGKTARAEGIPEELKTPPPAEPTVAELKQQLADVNTRIAGLESKHKDEVGGLTFDLKRERQIRQELEKQLSDKKTVADEEDPLKDKDETEYATVGDLKKLQAHQTAKERKAQIVQIKMLAVGQMDKDEERMIQATAKVTDTYPVPYEKALEAFDKLVKVDPSLWDDVNKEALRPNGKPAEKVYRIALLNDPDLSQLVKKSERERLIAELEKKPGAPKHLGGGGAGKPEIDLSTMSDEEILKAVKENPASVDKALGKT